MRIGFIKIVGEELEGKKKNMVPSKLLMTMKADDFELEPII